MWDLGEVDPDGASGLISEVAQARPQDDGDLRVQGALRRDEARSFFSLSKEVGHGFIQFLSCFHERNQLFLQQLSELLNHCDHFQERNL
jgi:hypothetical protein